MIFERDLTIFVDTTEHSQALADYNRDDVTFTLLSSQFLHVGLYKPFNKLYWEFVTADTAGVTLTAEYFNGTSFVPLNFFVDETLDLARSGTQTWQRPEDWTTTTVNGDDLFWVRFSVSVDTSSLTLRGLNILFANDNDLAKENSTITRFLPTGANSFAPLHERVRDDIVQMIRNRGRSTRKLNATLSENITKWDFLDSQEIRNAAIYFALEKIYFQASDGTADKWLQRSVQSRAMAGEAMNLFFLTLDDNDDGVVDTNENLKLTAIEVKRI